MAQHDQGGQHEPHKLGQRLYQDSQLFIFALLELLNRSDRFLWGVASNGLQLRLLRDNVSLTRQAFVEFDLETMLAAHRRLYAELAGPFRSLAVQSPGHTIDLRALEADKVHTT